MLMRLCGVNYSALFFQYDNPAVIIDLKQNVSEKSGSDVDIADVAYYFEKDVSTPVG